MNTIKPINPKKISISSNEKIALITNFTSMLNAGIPILETVESLIDDSKGNVKKFLIVLKEDLMQGQRIYITFAKFPQVFDKVTVNIIKAAEEGGTLVTALTDLKESTRKEMEFTDKIKSALIYPMFIMVVFVGVLLMILVVVIPKISTVFSRLNVELPLPTRMLIFMSNALIGYTIPVIALAALVIGSFILLFKRQKKVILQIITTFPIISQLAKEIDMTRFCRSMHLLLTAGLPIVAALELTEEVVTKKDVHDVIKNTRIMVSSGKRLSEGLKEGRKIIPSIIIKITESGEKTGSLDKAMQEGAEFLDYQVSGTLKTLTALIEPLMLVIVGILIGGMMLAIISPIYGLIGQVGSR